MNVTHQSRGWRWLCSNKANRTPCFVVMVAVASTHLARFSTSLAVCCESVFSHVVFVAFHNLQVLWSVIRSNMVYVMNSLTRLEPSPDHLLCNKNMLKNPVVVLVPSRVIPVYNKHISTLCNGFSIFVKRMFIWVISHVRVPAFLASYNRLTKVIVYWFLAIRARSVEVRVFGHSDNIATGSTECNIL